jgi:hypothetical protein
VVAGGIGQIGESAEQRRAIEGCLRGFVSSKYKPTWEKSYGVTETMHQEGRVSYRFIRNATINKKCFANSDYGKAVAAILRNLQEADFIKPHQEISSANGTTTTHYQILTPEGLYKGEV